MSEIALVHTTFPNMEVAESLSERILNGKLAACVNLNDMQSRYNWKGDLVKELEIAADFKTSVSKLVALKAFLQMEHPYEVPCIYHQITQASVSYAEWVEASTSEDQAST